MAAKHLCLGLTGCIISLVVGVSLHSSVLGVGFVLASAAILGWVVGSLVHPWLGERVHYRVRYHAPDAASLQSAAIGQGLASLAKQGGAVALIWQRKGGELTLFMEVPATLDEALRGMLPRLLPGARLEAVPAPPPLSVKAGAYRWPLTQPCTGPADAGQSAPDPLNFTQLLSGEVLTGDLELRVHMLAAGATVVVQGTPSAEAAATDLSPLWPLFSRYVERRIGPPRTTKAARKQGRIRLLRPRTSSSRPTLSVLLFRRYSLIDAGAYHGTPSAHALSTYFPATAGPGTLRLSSVESSMVPLPEGYSYPVEEGAILLGVSTVDGRRIGQPPLCGEAQALEPDAAAPAARHFLVVGESDAERDATVRMVVDGVVGLGSGLLYLDSSEDGARHMSAQLPPVVRPRRGWIDMDNPAGSIRLNLLSVSPVEGKENSAAAEAAALVSAIEDQVPLLGAYLLELGVSSWVNQGGSNLLLDWARVLLIAHHRARLTGDLRQISEAPAPDLQTLYELLNEPEALPAFVAQECAEWASPTSALAAQLCMAGADGVQAVRVARDALTALDDRLVHMGASHRGLLAASLRDQLRLALRNPSLSRMWRGPFTAPAELLGHNPGPVLLARLPLSGAAPADGGAARWYGSYIVACMVAAARWRIRSAQRSLPLLMVLQNVSVWLTGNMLQLYLDELGRAGISMLATTPELSRTEEGGWLLDSTGTWWLHSLGNSDSDMLHRRLRNLGVQADLSLSDMPSGVAVLKFPGTHGPAVATVYTGKSHIRDAAKATLSL